MTFLLHLMQVVLLLFFSSISLLLLIKYTDHSIVTHRIQRWFGISFTALNLLSSFLSNRSQTVITPISKSKPVSLEYSVPQGSILRPLLHSSYTIPLHFITSKYPNICCHFYAHDT